MKEKCILVLISLSSLFCFNLFQAKAIAVEVSQSEQPQGEQPQAGDGSEGLVGPSPGQLGSLVGPSVGSVITPESANEQFKPIPGNSQAVEIERSRQVAEAAPKPAPVAPRPVAPRPEPAYIPKPRPYVAQAPAPVVAPAPEPSYIASAPPAAAPPAPLPTKPSPKKVVLKEVTFQCGEDGSAPATVVKARDNNQFFVILWKSDVFKTAGYDAATRCKQVSARFEEYNKGKLFTYLTTGKLNGQPVVCLTSKADGTCGDDSISLNQGLLFTLKPGETAAQTLENLVAVLGSEGGSKQEPLDQ